MSSLCLCGQEICHLCVSVVRIWVIFVSLWSGDMSSLCLCGQEICHLCVSVVKRCVIFVSLWSGDMSLCHTSSFVVSAIESCFFVSSHITCLVD